MSDQPFINVHTHDAAECSGVVRIFNFLAGETTECPKNSYYSVGLHPWFIEKHHHEDLMEKIAQWAKNKNCLAIGETGIDRRIKTPVTLQQQIFEQHLNIAGELQKPIIIHNVKAHTVISQMIKTSHFQQPVIFHGFNNNRQIAGELLSKGFYLSFGKALLNPKSNAAMILKTFPADRFFLENDDSEFYISTIYEMAASLRNQSTEELKKIVADTFNTCFLP